MAPPVPYIKQSNEQVTQINDKSFSWNHITSLGLYEIIYGTVQYGILKEMKRHFIVRNNLGAMYSIVYLTWAILVYYTVLHDRIWGTGNTARNNDTLAQKIYKSSKLLRGDLHHLCLLTQNMISFSDLHREHRRSTSLKVVVVCCCCCCYHKTLQNRDN